MAPSCRDMDCLCCRSYGPIGVFFRTSCSWRSEGLFGQSFSVALPIQALQGFLCPGSFSVVQHVRHIEDPPPTHSRVLLCSSVRQACDGPASLLFSCRCWHVGRERGYGDGSTPYTRLSSITLLPPLPGFPLKAFPTTISITFPQSVSPQSTTALNLGLLHNP